MYLFFTSSFLVLLLVMFVIFSTAYDYFRERWIPNCDTGLQNLLFWCLLTLRGSSFLGNLQHRLFIAFSVRKNISELPKADESTPSLKIFHGVRIFCTLMIITVHRFGTFMFGPIKNLDYLENVEFPSLSQQGFTWLVCRNTEGFLRLNGCCIMATSSWIRSSR